MKYYKMEVTTFLQIMDKKYRILQYISQNPGVTSADIKVNLSRSSIGVYARMLLDEGIVQKNDAGEWSLADGYIMQPIIKEETPMDIVEKQIRQMIEMNDQR
jgi:predicted transcriptional regulator